MGQHGGQRRRHEPDRQHGHGAPLLPQQSHYRHPHLTGHHRQRPRAHHHPHQCTGTVHRYGTHTFPIPMLRACMRAAPYQLTIDLELHWHPFSLIPCCRSGGIHYKLRALGLHQPHARSLMGQPALLQRARLPGAGRKRNILPVSGLDWASETGHWRLGRYCCLGVALTLAACSYGITMNNEQECPASDVSPSAAAQYAAIVVFLATLTPSCLQTAVGIGCKQTQPVVNFGAGGLRSALKCYVPSRIFAA